MELILITRCRFKLLGILLLILTASSACSQRAPISGFEPIEPPQRFGPWRNSLRVPLVSSIQPVFSWKTFPGTHEACGFPCPKSQFVDVDPAKVEKVTYQLRIWDVEINVPTAVVYDRSGIEGTSHRVEVPLDYGKVYFWSVRAEFVYAGEMRLTEWSISSLPHYGRTARSAARKRGVIPPRNYFRFKTPDS